MTGGRVILFAAGVMWLLIAAGPAQAQCPPDCPLKGGGPVATDCLLEFNGAQPASPGSRMVSCTDGDPTCDHDGEINGHCAFDITACLNNADPSLPSCTVSGLDQVIVRGQSSDAEALQNAITALLPTSSNACTTPVRIDIPVRAHVTSTAELGDRHFSINPSTSPFMIGGLPIALANFSGYFDFHAGAPDPVTGLVPVYLTGASDFIQGFIGLAGSALCLKPTVPDPASNPAPAGWLACGGKPTGRLFRVTASGSGGSDRDAFALVCKANYTTMVSQDHNIGVVGQGGYTADDCHAAGGSIDDFPGDEGVCNGPLRVAFLSDIDTTPGALFIAPYPPLAGIQVQLSQESALPCGDEAPGATLSIAFTTERSAGEILDANNQKDATVQFDVTGQNFSCDDWTTEDGPGQLVLAAPQLHLPMLGDGITLFKLSDK